MTTSEPLVADFVMSVVRALVRDPAKVQVEALEDGTSTIFQVTVAMEDVGRVLGNAGSLAKAVRVLLRAMGYYRQKRFYLTLTNGWSDEREFE